MDFSCAGPHCSGCIACAYIHCIGVRLASCVCINMGGDTVCMNNREDSMINNLCHYFVCILSTDCYCYDIAASCRYVHV